MKTAKFVLFAFLICRLYITAAEGTPAKYMIKYRHSDFNGIINCYYDDEKNEYVHKIDDKIIQIFKYGSKSDFVRERNSFGLSLNISQTINKDDFSDTGTFSYDGDRLLREKSIFMEINWFKWDKKNRNTAGEMTLTGAKMKIPVKVVYSDKLKTMTVKLTFPGDFLNENPGVVIESIRYYDDFNNTIHVVYKKYNRQVTEEIYTEIEYADIK